MARLKKRRKTITRVVSIERPADSPSRLDSVPVIEPVTEWSDGVERSTFNLIVPNDLWLHTLPLAKFVTIANKFEGEILITSKRRGRVFDGKSIMDMLLACLGPGSDVTIVGVGSGGEEVVKRLSYLVLVELPAYEAERKETQRAKIDYWKSRW